MPAILRSTRRCNGHPPRTGSQGPSDRASDALPLILPAEAIAVMLLILVLALGLMIRNGT